MRVKFIAAANSWKAVKVLRSSKPKIFRQTSIHEFFYSNDYKEESSDEEEPPFIVPDEPIESDDEESLDLGPNLFEEDDQDEDEADDQENKEIFKSLKELKFDFFNEDGSIDIE